MIAGHKKEQYFKKSKDDLIIEENTIDNEFGFATWNINPKYKALIIHNLFGDGQYWEQFFIGLAKRLGLKKIMFLTKRNPKAFERRFKCKLVGYLLEREV